MIITQIMGPWDVQNAINGAPVVKNRDEMARLYADALMGGVGDRAGELNEAILKRWTMAGLIYIKERAWKIWRERRAAAKARAN